MFRSCKEIYLARLNLCHHGCKRNPSLRGLVAGKCRANVAKADLIALALLVYRGDGGMIV
jgi:hypothetical protein